MSLALANRFAPARGEHADEVLGDRCGYAPQRLDELSAPGVFGPQLPKQ
jgi:hypothetical protein